MRKRAINPKAAMMERGIAAMDLSGLILAWDAGSRRRTEPQEGSVHA